MITRQQIADAYNCCVNLVRPRLRKTGINHMRSLSLEEFREYIRVNGWPINKKYHDLAESAMNIPSTASCTNTSAWIHVAFTGVQRSVK